MTVTLPRPIELYFAAENSGDPSGLDACLAAGVTVRDEGRTHTGFAEVKRWKAETKKKYGHTVEPLSAKEHDGETVVSGRVAGNFPGSPVILEFRFMLAGDRIRSLEIGT